LPFVRKNPPEKIIIYGDLFHNTTTTSFKLIGKIKETITKLSEITKVEILDNDYCKFLFENSPNVETIDSNGYDQPKLSIPRPNLFQMNKGDKTTPGFLAVKGDKCKFIENFNTPRYLEIEINAIKDLESLEKTKDFVDLIINSDLLDKPDYKNKIAIFLNKNEFDNVYYTDKKEKEIIVNYSSIRNILLDNMDVDLRESLQDVFKVYDEKRS
jgi:hypothetical protein